MEEAEVEAANSSAVGTVLVDSAAVAGVAVANGTDVSNTSSDAVLDNPIY